MKRKRFENLRTTSGLVWRNWRAFIMFELLYKLALGTAVFPLLGSCFTGIMKISGYPYLTMENVIPFFRHPLTILLLVAFLLLAATFTMIDVSAIIYTLDQSRQEVRARLGDIIRFSVRNAVRVWKPQNSMLAAVVLLLMPFLSMGIATGVLNTISLPEFIMDYIQSNTGYSLLFSGGTFLLGFLMMRWLYTLHYYTLEGCSFREAHRKSSVLSKHHKVGDFLTMAVVQGVFGAGQLVVSAILVFFAIWVSNTFDSTMILQWITGTGVWITVVLAMLAAFALSTPVSYAVVSALFYYHKKQIGEEEIHIPAREEEEENPNRLRVHRRVFGASAVLILAAALGFGYLLVSGRINPQIEFVRTMEITAHRGASALYPENTMAAFRGARELGANWAELDVQQTKDGQIIVMHDSNTKRTTGLDANVWDLTYEEIQKLDAGSFFGEEFAGEPVPLLSEVADYSRESGLRLNIELKPTGHEKDLEKDVIDIVTERGLENDCVITSQTYQALENVKAYNPDITTVYVMSLAYGDVTRLDAADHFSVEASSATSGMVSRVHNAGKQIYAWTVNSESSINSMIERNVDNIITDNIPLARKCVEESRYSDLFSEFMDMLE